MQKHQVKVKKEKLATRCEICHQDDVFNPVTEECLRCSNIEKALERKSKISQSLWSPRFSLLEDSYEKPSFTNDYKRSSWIVLAGNLCFALLFLYFQSWVGVIVTSFAAICGIVELVKIYKEKLNINNWKEKLDLFKEPDTNQVTTLFDKYPEEKVQNFYDLPNNKTEITTLFGDERRKNRQ